MAKALPEMEITRIMADCPRWGGLAPPAPYGLQQCYSAEEGLCLSLSLCPLDSLHCTFRLHHSTARTFRTTLLDIERSIPNSRTSSSPLRSESNSRRTGQAPAIVQRW